MSGLPVTLPQFGQTSMGRSFPLTAPRSSRTRRLRSTPPDVQTRPRQENRNPMRAMAAVSVIALLFVAPASATVKRWYWTEEKAETVAAAKIRIPYCVMWPNEERCQGVSIYNEHGWPRFGFYGLNEVTCNGADEKGDSFTYGRFKCRFIAGVRVQDYGVGTLVLYPAGPWVMRWKLVSLRTF